MRGVLLVPSSSTTLWPIYDGVDVYVTSDITWFHLNHDMVSRRIYKLPFYGGQSITFDRTVDCKGLHEAVSSSTLVVNRRDNPVVVSYKKNNSYAEKHVEICKELRTCHAAIGLRDSIEACTPFDVTAEFTVIHYAN